jgi:hypothetical protein
MSRTDRFTPWMGKSPKAFPDRAAELSQKAWKPGDHSGVRS